MRTRLVAGACARGGAGGKRNGQQKAEDDGNPCPQGRLGPHDGNADVATRPGGVAALAKDAGGSQSDGLHWLKSGVQSGLETRHIVTQRTRVSPEMRGLRLA